MAPIYVFIVASIALGGGPGQLDFALLAWCIAALFLIVSRPWQNWNSSLRALPSPAQGAVWLWLTLPFFQLVPLPPSIWQTLPGSEIRTAIAQHFGMGSQWMPLSLSPIETTYTAIVSLGMFTFFTAIISLTERQLRQAIWVIVGMFALATTIGVIQYTSSGQLLQFHSLAHRTSLLGFFANKNHMALALACMIPLGYALIKDLPGEGAIKNYQFACLFGLVFALLITTNSRAGLAFGMIATLATLFHIAPKRRALVASIFVGAVALLSAILSLVPNIAIVMERFGNTSEDGRLDMLAQSWPLIEQYSATGSGFGSFSEVFVPNEKLEWLLPNYVNQLHNDWVQFVMEGGIPAGLIIILVIISLTMATLKARAQGEQHSSSGSFEANILWASMVIIALFGLHSIIDYPARRIASLMLLIFALSLTMRPYVLAQRKLAMANS